MKDEKMKDEILYYKDERYKQVGDILWPAFLFLKFASLPFDHRVGLQMLYNVAYS